MRLLARLVHGDPPRKTRMHDIRGHALDSASWVNLPLAVGDLALYTTLRVRRAVPWISYRATNDLGRLISPDWRVLEYGAGMSTVWFASRARFVFSVESNPEWHRRIREILDRRRLTNVQLEYRPSECGQYADLRELEDHSFDLALIDGECREVCVSASLLKVRRGGYVYLDNTDQPGDKQAAEADLLAAPHSLTRYYNDFAPRVVTNTQGLLVRLAD